MKLIKPSEISGKLLSLFDDSEEWLIIVSPYVRISKWYKLCNKLQVLQGKGIQINFFVRDGKDNTDTFKDLDQLGINYRKIPHLHSKLYLSEKEGLITSMNLLLSSEIHAKEIAMATESWGEFNELLCYFRNYIGDKPFPSRERHHPRPERHLPRPERHLPSPERHLPRLKSISAGPQEMRIRELIESKLDCWCWQERNTLHFTTGNLKFCSWVQENRLRINVTHMNTKINGIQDLRICGQKISDQTAMAIQVHEGSLATQLLISGQAKRNIKSTSIAGCLSDEVAYIRGRILKFAQVCCKLLLPRG